MKRTRKKPQTTRRTTQHTRTEPTVNGTLMDIRCGIGTASCCFLSSSPLPELGPLLWSPEDQAAAPKEQRTRLVKDVLTPGTWYIGEDETEVWEVTPQTLNAIVSDWRRMRSNGVPCNLLWGHFAQHKSGEIDPLRLIAKAQDVFVHDNTLYIVVYVNVEEALTLQKDVMQVSVRVCRKWKDGRGNQYELPLLHVAVVDHAVMTPQGRFIQMSKGTKKMIDLAQAVAAINKMLAALGMNPLPDTVTEENFNTILDVVASMVATDEEAEGDDGDPPPDDTALVNAAAAAGSGGDDMQLGKKGGARLMALIQKAIENATAPLKLQVMDLGKKMNQGAAQSAKAAQAVFKGRLVGLVANGMTGAQAEAFTRAGAAAGWDVSLLPGGEDMLDLGRGVPGVFSQQQSNVLAQGGARPAPKHKALTADDVKKAASELRTGKAS